MSSSKETAGYQEIIRGLLTRVPTHLPRTVEFEPSEKLKAARGVRPRSASGPSPPDRSHVMATGSIPLDDLTSRGPPAFSPVETTVAEAREHNRAALRPARGIVISLALGLVLWGLIIGGILMAIFR
jgi:hypothetical protein